MMKYCLFLIVVFLMVSCSDDSNVIFEATEDVEEVEEEEVGDDGDMSNPREKAGKITVLMEDKTQVGYVLVNDARANRVYLMDKLEAFILTEWNLPAGIGNDAEILDDGNLLVALTDDEPAYQFGGYGGRVAIISPEDEIVWDYEYSDSINLSHHDVEMLPNGNVLILAWEKRTKDELTSKAYDGPYENLYVEKILEVDPSNNETIWEWNVWNHLVQDVDVDSQDYGVIADNPERVNINYEDPLKNGNYNGDIFHANAIEYDVENDLIYMSVNHFSEVWVIDHSTTLEQAKGSTGGIYNKGGDLVYRFGNPDAYENSSGDRMFYHNHNPTLVLNSNRILVFSNGLPALDPHSIVYELELPAFFNLIANKNNELDVIWSFQHEDLFSAKVSGAHRLPNGNTLITEGTSGFWEVTNEKEIVWKFEGDGFFWRGYHYDLNSTAIEKYDL